MRFRRRYHFPARAKRSFGPRYTTVCQENDDDRGQGLTKRYGDKTAVDDLTLHRPARRGHRVPRPERRREVHDDADDPRTRRARPPGRSRSTAARTREHARTAARGRRAAGGPRGAHRPHRAFNHLLALAATTASRAAGSTRSSTWSGLREVARKRAGGFSLGMGQRLGIAAALLGDPQTLILDEPVNGLDPEGIRWIRNLLKALAAEGRTVFVSSHLMSEMALTAEHLIVIGRGRLIADTSVEEFTARASPAARCRSGPRRGWRLRDLLAGPDVSVSSSADGGPGGHRPEL